VKTCLNIIVLGQHPTTYGEIVDREVCASLAGKCCTRRWFIRVAFCGDFYSYLLTDTPGCFMAYCAGMNVYMNVYFSYLRTKTKAKAKTKGQRLRGEVERRGTSV